MSLAAGAEGPKIRLKRFQENAVGHSLGSSLLDLVLPLLVFVVCLAYLLPFLQYSSLEPDEGIVLRGAERILSGELPYRDFFSFYTPGPFYIVAFVFRFFGDSFVIARLSIAVAGAICSVVTYVLARRVSSPAISLFCAILATTTGAAFRFLVLHNAYSTLICCLTLYAALWYLEAHTPTSALIVGSLSSLTFLVEQSKGAGLCLGLALVFLISWRFEPRPLFQNSALFALTIGFALPLVFTFAYFAAHHSLGVMLESWLWPLQHYTRANRVPYGFQNWSESTRTLIFGTGPLWLRGLKIVTISPGLLIPVLPLIAIGVFLTSLARLWRGRESFAESKYYVLIGSVCLGLFASIVFSRADVLHFVYLAPVWYVVLAWILGSRVFRSPLLIASRPYLITYVGSAFGMLGLAVLLNATGAGNRVVTRRGQIRTGAVDSVIPYVVSHVKTGEELLVYPYLPLYNYLTGTLSPSRYDYFQPGMNTPEQARDIIAVMDRKQVPKILFEPWFAEKIANSWVETPLKAVATDPVADYIVRNYRFRLTTGQ